MKEPATRHALLLKFYAEFLERAESPPFIAAVSQRYTTGTLMRLVSHEDFSIRRAAVLALGFVGDYSCSNALGPALHDKDRGVRMVADDAMRAIWLRDGSLVQRHALAKIIRLNECEQYEQVISECSSVIQQHDRFAEAYNQRGIARFQLNQFEMAVDDCRRTVALNRFHYAAWIGIGHCQIELGEVLSAVEAFRQALAIYPDLEPVRLQVKRLEKSLQEPF